MSYNNINNKIKIGGHVMDFPDILKMLREKNGYSQQQLADILHLSKNSISHYELGVCMPSIDVLINIADVFDVSLDYLLGRSSVNISKKLLEKAIDKNVTVSKFLETVLLLDKDHRNDLLKMLKYISKDNKSI